MPFINVSPFHEFLSGMNFILQINVGVVKLTGAYGTGKTAMLQELVRSTRQAQQDIVMFYAAPASFEQIKVSIREQLNLDPAVNFHDAVLNHVLAKPLDQRRLIIVIDNAEFMEEETLLAVGHLRTIRHAGQSLIGLVLCGSPELSRILRQPEHRLLAEEILLSYELSPLSPQQLPDFCRACLAARGLDGLVLTADDYRQIMQKSGGLPGKVAELVETYWPEDSEIAESLSGPGKIASVPPTQEPAEQQDVFEPQSTASLENITTVAEPIFFSSPRSNVAPDVTPVLSPDMSFEYLADGSFAVAADTGSPYISDAVVVAADAAPAVYEENTANVAPEALLDFASGFTPQNSYDTPVEDTTAVAPDIAAEFAHQGFAENTVDVLQQPALSDFSNDPAAAARAGFVSDNNYEQPPQVSADVADAIVVADAVVADEVADAASMNNTEITVPRPAELLTEISASVVYATMPFAANDLAADAGVNVPADMAVDPQLESAVYAAADTAPEVVTEAEATVFNVAAEVLQEKPADIPQVLEVTAASDAFADGTYDVSPAPQEEVAFDFSTATPVEIALGLAPEPATAAAAEAPQDNVQTITPVAASMVAIVPQPAPNRMKTIVGALVLASVAVVAAQILKTTSDTIDSAPAAVAVAEPAPTQPASQNSIATVSVQQFGQPPATTATVAGEVVPQPLPTAPAQPAVQSSPATVTLPTENAPVAVAASPNSAAAMAAVAEGVVNAWIDAWESQNVDAYLAFYHADFVPPNGASRDGWENNRNRIISSQSSITIDMEDFTVLGSSGNQTQVQFLLTYRGDNYADRTLKELTLQPDANGELRIVAEQNLQTEAFDPVIEAASRWMPDSAGVRGDTSVANSAAVTNQATSAVFGATADTGASNLAGASQQNADATIPLIFNLTNLTDTEVGQVNGVLQAWAEAWQSKDTQGYFSHYHADYKAPEAASVSQWREERVARITAADQISINLEELEILQNNDDNLLLELLMEYRTDTYADRTLKRMMLSKSAQGQWLITMESNVEVERL